MHGRRRRLRLQATEIVAILAAVVTVAPMILPVASDPVLVADGALLILARRRIVQAELMAHFERLAHRPHDAHRLALQMKRVCELCYSSAWDDFYHVGYITRIVCSLWF